MGYVLRVRMASFFAGAATASLIGLSVLYKDYQVAHESISHQAKAFHDLLDTRISTLESLRQTEAPHLPQTTAD
ncbi:ABC transporter A family protein [Hirschfeldia incana]|nr:ABC transporter A family protein [Hirschfeldia incana]